MSTCYHIKAPEGERLTREQVDNVVRERGLSTSHEKGSDLVVAVDGRDWVHLYIYDDQLVEFERFGANDPTWFIELMEEFGFEVVSEHDDDYPTD